MCWSATTSFVTLGIGTLLNIASYIFLRYRDSPTSLLVWSWHYALLMQLPEGIVWLQLDDGHSDIAVASRTALFLNITQPLALLIGIRFGGLFREFRYAYVAMLMYFVVIFSQFEEIWTQSESIAPSTDCPHLNLRYWDTSRGLVYVATSLLVVSEVRPFFWVAVHSAIFLVTLTIAIVAYPCGVGSVWCWFIFVTGPVLVLSEEAKRRIISRNTPNVTSVEIVAERPRPVISWRKPTI